MKLWMRTRRRGLKALNYIEPACYFMNEISTRLGVHRAVLRSKEKRQTKRKQALLMKSNAKTNYASIGLLDTRQPNGMT